MKFGSFCRSIFRAISVSPPTSPGTSTTIDLREEYANAFRTESYNEFWARVLDLTAGDVATLNTLESTAAARLPSYRLFAEHLLDPDQSTVTRLMARVRIHTPSKYHTLLVDYFAQTAKASLLCGLLLKDIEQARITYRPLKTALHVPGNHVPTNISDKLAAFSATINPFGLSASSPTQFRALQEGCNGLLKQLELGRDEAQAKLRLISRLKHGLAIFLVLISASTALTGVLVATHALVLLTAGPIFWSAWLPLNPARRAAQVSTQLNAAAKGIYILNRDLDTMSRLVARLNNELDHAQGVVRFYLERCDEGLEPNQEVVRQLKKIDSSFCHQLDELEEHLYLCFMTVNRARSLVMKEVMKLGHA